MAEASPQPAIDLGRLAPGLRGVCNEYLGSYRDRLAAAVQSGRPGLEVAREHATILDGLLGALFCAADAAARTSGHTAGGRVALVAVGGYGRGLVALHSDVDVLFLCDDPGDAHAKALAEGLLYPLWDLGLDIGHAVRGVHETVALAREDIRTATTLLDLRPVAGRADIVHDLDSLSQRQVFEPCLDSFLDALARDTTDRHERFGGSLYLLEPEVKLGRGGLRDADVARWAAQARWGRGTDPVRTGVLLSREVRELDHAREMLWRVRNLLHLRAGRQQDRLTFADQEEIAIELGFVDGVTLGVEQFMQAYYRHARVVAQTAERMLERARPPRRRSPGAARPFGDGTQEFDGAVTFERTEELKIDPALSLRLYRQVVRRRLPPYGFARDAVARVSVDPAFGEELRGSEEARTLFLSLLTHVGDAPLRRGSILGELHEVGLMLAMIPEFEAVTGRVQHDVYHVYTVDVHSVAAVDRLRALMRGELASELPLASRLAAEEPRRVPLFLGLLLHDIGKAHGKDHSEKGASMAGPIAERLGLSELDVAHVVWLVREHLRLYHWATRRDTSDPETLSDVARYVGTPERLRDLYLLTVADLSTTNPSAMTSWKARMLDDLYVRVARTLDEEVEGAASSRASQLRAEVRLGFAGERGQEALEAFVDAMPDRYLLANPVDVVRQHARIARARDDAPLHVAGQPGPLEDFFELVVVTDDRPGLLSDVTAVLAAHRLAVAGAQIYTRRRPGAPDEAFDVFHVRRARSNAPVDAPLLAKVERDLSDLLSGRVDAETLLARLPSRPAWAERHRPDVPTEITVDNDASPAFTVVDVYTRDRVGLLHAIARTLHDHRLTIALSKVNTEGLRVADVFYVEDAGGGKVRNPARLAEVRWALTEAVDALEDGQDGGMGA